VDHTILGIGLNVGQRKSDFPAPLRRKATSLLIALGREVEKPALEAALWPRLDRWYAAFTRGRREEIVEAYESKLAIPPGAVIEVRREGQILTGLFRGIDSRARLKLEKDGEIQMLSPAEILAIDYNK
jgi:BirA family biotin operon repressor/biotin-[acetyl-CoA-carboxylase] ligase